MWWVRKEEHVTFWSMRIYNLAIQVALFFMQLKKPTV
jgi:hypothetical protein